MKKILTTLSILLGIYSASFAQTKTTSEFGFGIGYNSSTVSISETGQQNSSYGSGFNAGVSGDFYFSNRWSIKAKLSYDQKGWNNGFLSFNDGTVIEGVNYHLNYLTVPVMANWHFGRTRNWYLDFGPYAGFLLSANESSNSANIKPLFNSTDFGLAFGIGVKIPVSEKAKLFLEYDGQGGLTNIFNVSYQTIQNVRSSFNIGFSFPIN